MHNDPSQSTPRWFANSTVALVMVAALALVSFFIHVDHVQALHAPLPSQPLLPTAAEEGPQRSVPVDAKTRMNTVSWVPVAGR